MCVAERGSETRGNLFGVRLTGLGKTGATIITAKAAGMSDTAVVTFDAPTFSGVSLGKSWFACALTSNNDAYCRGEGEHGQLAGAIWAQVPIRITGVKFSVVSTGMQHACGLAVDSGAYCWGRNSYGQAGGSASQADVWLPQRIDDGAYRQISAGRYHTCALDQVGAARCWGLQYGAASSGPEAYSKSLAAYAPVLVPGGHRFAMISAGYEHTCGITSSGEAMCWGLNDHGQLGNGTQERSTDPVVVVGGLAFSWISAGPYHTCGVTTVGEAYCWGEEGAEGGYVTQIRSTTPAKVALPAGVVLKSVDVGGGPTCGVATDDSVYCWGFAWNGDVTETGMPPTKVTGGLSFVSVSSGWADGLSCGVTREPSVYCWILRMNGNDLPPYLGTPFKYTGEP